MGCSLRAIVFLAVCGLLGACTPGYTPIEGRDRDTFFPTLRLAYPLKKTEPEGPRTGASASSDQTGGRGSAAESPVALEVDLSTSKGTSVQTLSSPQIISLNNVSFSGSTPIKQTFSLDVGSLALRLGTPRDKAIYMDLLPGIIYTQRDLQLESGGTSARGKHPEIGILLGFGVGLAVIDHITLDFRLATDAALDHDLQMGEAFATLWLSPSAGLMGGYRRWHYKETTDGSDLDLLWSGYAAGLFLGF